jgi:hypothetical protein
MSGSLLFMSAPGQHGLALIRVFANDDGGTDFDGQSKSQTVESVLKVFPIPRVLDVVPAVLPASGGDRVTVIGLYFGSPYSRGYDEPKSGYGLLDVMIGGRECANVSVISDTEAQCIVPPMVGTQDVQVVIREPGLARSGRMARTISFNAVYFGGALQERGARGFFGTGPASNHSVPFVEWVPSGVDPPTPSHWEGVPVAINQLVVDNTVLSMLYYQSSVFAGGNFKTAGVVKVNHIMQWNGARVLPLGKGVDGAVHSLIIYQGLLVVGGTFTKAYQNKGGALRTGGLAGWRLSADARQEGTWELIGAPLQGAVMSSAVNGSRLYVGGRFNQFVSQRFNGVATYDGASWQPLGQGVSGGAVMCMAVLGKMLYVGGDFTSAGGKPLGMIAAWNVESSAWHFVGKVDGHVLALLHWDGHIILGGTFVTAGDNLAFGIARYSPAHDQQREQADDEQADDGWSDGVNDKLGVWNSVGRGIEGRVNRLAAAGGCLYAAGAFTSVSDHNGSRPAIANLARYCPNGEEGNASAVWEPAVVVNGGEQQSLAPLYALASAIPAGTAHFGLRRRQYEWQCGINASNATWYYLKGTEWVEGFGDPYNSTEWVEAYGDEEGFFNAMQNATFVKVNDATNGTCVLRKVSLPPLVFY